MKFDDLRATWQETNKALIPPESREQRIVRVCRRAERFGASLFRRDLVETLVCLFIIACFGWEFVEDDKFVVKVGCAVLVLGSVSIMFRMHRARTTPAPARLESPVREFCQIEIDRINRQIQLLRSVLWWYLTPIFVGVNLVYVGHKGIGFAALIYFVATAILNWGIYWLNQRAVTHSLLPQRAEMVALLDELDNAN